MRRNMTVLVFLGGLMAAAAGIMPPPPAVAVLPSQASVRQARKAAGVRALPPTPEHIRQAQEKEARGGQKRPFALSCRKRLYNRRIIGALCRAA